MARLSTARARRWGFTPLPDFVGTPPQGEKTSRFRKRSKAKSLQFPRRYEVSREYKSATSANSPPLGECGASRRGVSQLLRANSPPPEGETALRWGGLKKTPRKSCGALFLFKRIITHDELSLDGTRCVEYESCL